MKRRKPTKKRVRTISHETEITGKAYTMLRKLVAHHKIPADLIIEEAIIEKAAADLNV